MFNLMFRTFMGPVEEGAGFVYLRSETAQGIYVNYLNVLQSSRQKIPFGIAQVGKAFRNEITPGNFIFRTREFEQMEMQFFVKPGTDAEWFDFWRHERMKWLVGLGLHAEKLRFHQHTKDELAHYAKDAYDIQYEFPFGWQEFEGIHNRTNFDLSRHQEFSGKKLEYLDAASNERYIPYVVETSAGADRTTLVVLVDAYHEEEVEGDKRVVLRIHPAIAPLKAAVFPLVNKDGMPELARRIYDELRRPYNVFYHDGGSNGAGTGPICSPGSSSITARSRPWRGSATSTGAPRLGRRSRTSCGTTSNGARTSPASRRTTGRPKRTSGATRGSPSTRCSIGRGKAWRTAWGRSTTMSSWPWTAPAAQRSRFPGTAVPIGSPSRRSSRPRRCS